jgi:hypothetical protein
MTTTAEAIWQNLPSVYRRAGPATPAHGLAVTFGRMLVDLERIAQDVLRAHHLNNATDLIDLARLAAWYHLAPWPEEEKEAFRTRVRRMAAIYREGAANAERMLDLLAVAMGADIADMQGRRAVFLPQLTWQEAQDEEAKPAKDRRPSHVPWPRAGSDWAYLVPETRNVYATYAIFTQMRGGATWGIPAALLEMPLHRTSRRLQPDPALGRLEWQVQPPYRTLGDDPSQDTYGDPVVTIYAPEGREVVMPILVQPDLRRAVLVNRKIPPGGAVQVNLDTLEVVDVVGTSTIGRVTWPKLLFGAGSALGEHKLGQGPPPFRLLKWYKAANLRRSVPQPGDLAAWVANPEAEDGKLCWPPLLTPLSPAHRTVPWRLLLADPSVSPAFNPIQPTPATTVAAIEFAMEGRRPGTFTLLYDEEWVLHGEDGALRAHRAEWLQEQISRLKLAGVVYLPPSAVTESLNLPPAMPLGAAMRTLHESARMVDTVEMVRETFLDLAEAVVTGDGFESTKEAFAELTDALGAGDQPPNRVLEAIRELGDSLASKDEAGRQLRPTNIALTEKLAVKDSVQATAQSQRRPK